MSDPLQVAVKMATVEGALTLMAQQLASGISNVEKQLTLLQTEGRENGIRIAGIATSQSEIQAHSQGLERISVSIERMIEENVQWRRTHEAENRGVSDAVTSARGAVKLIAWAGVFVIGLIVFTVQMQFDSSAVDRRRIEAAHSVDAGRLERQIEKMEAVQVSRERRFQALEQAAEATKERTNMKGLK